MKYVIDLELIPNTNLYRAKGFKTLVFDNEGIAKLKPLESDLEPRIGDVVRTIDGTTLYEFRGYIDGDKMANGINIANRKFCCLQADKLVVVER